MGVTGGMAEGLCDPVQQPVRDHVLEHLGVLLDLVPPIAEGGDQVGFDQPLRGAGP